MLKDIFKAYDIRGVYGEDLTEDVSFKIGQAYAVFMKKDTGKKSLKIAVGQDMRTHSLPLKKRLIEGLVDQGIDVVDIGLVSTPAFYFGVANYHHDGGIMVSASHNAKQFNGFKLVGKEAIPI